MVHTIYAHISNRYIHTDRQNALRNRDTDTERRRTEKPKTENRKPSEPSENQPNETSAKNLSVTQLCNKTFY